MSQFDEYLKEKREQEFSGQLQKSEYELLEEQRDFAFYETPDIYQEQREKGLGPGAESEAKTVYDVNEQLRERMEQSTFEERTRYYFEDQKYLESKAERYQTLAQENNSELELHAEKYTNRSAKKRRNKAAAAAKAFRKAMDIEKKLEADREQEGESIVTPIQQYWNRNEIMRLRMDGMINAAKAKATSDKDEGYRIAKAKLSCLSILYDQATTLKKESEDQKNFNTIEKNLLKEIADAQKDLKKYAPTAEEKWKASLNYDRKTKTRDPKHAEKLLKESGNPYATKEDAELSLITQKMGSEFQRGEYVRLQKQTEEALGARITNRRDEMISMIYFVKRDEFDNPVDKLEAKKQAWNERWLAAVSDKEKVLERKKLIMESMNRIKEYPFPAPAELRKHGAVYYLKKDPTGTYEVLNKALRLDNLANREPVVREYWNNDKVFRFRMDCAHALSDLLKEELAGKHYIVENNSFGLEAGDRNAEKDEESIEENKEELKNTIETKLKQYEEAYPRIEESERIREQLEEKEREETRTRTREEMQKAHEEVGKPFDDTIYEKYKILKESDQTLHCPQYLSMYSYIQKKLGSHNDMSRIAGSLLRIVHFNKNWEPVDKEDMENHEWNMNVLNRLYNIHVGMDLFNDDRTLMQEELKEAEENREEPHSQILDDIEKEKENSRQELMKMMDEEYKRSFDETGFPLPDPKLLKEELEASLQSGVFHMDSMEAYFKKYGDFSRLVQKSASFEGIYKSNTVSQKYVEEKYPDYCAYTSAMGTLGSVFAAYVQNKYSLDISSIEEGTETGRKIAVSAPEIMIAIIDSYESSYQKYNDLKKEK